MVSNAIDKNQLIICCESYYLPKNLKTIYKIIKIGKMPVPVGPSSLKKIKRIDCGLDGRDQ